MNADLRGIVESTAPSSIVGPGRLVAALEEQGILTVENALLAGVEGLATALDDGHAFEVIKRCIAELKRGGANAAAGPAQAAATAPPTAPAQPAVPGAANAAAEQRHAAERRMLEYMAHQQGEQRRAARAQVVHKQEVHRTRIEAEELSERAEVFSRFVLQLPRGAPATQSAVPGRGATASESHILISLNNRVITYPITPSTTVTIFTPGLFTSDSAP